MMVDKSIAVLYYGDSHALNGAALYVNRFNTYKEKFSRYHCFVNVFDSPISRIHSPSDDISNKEVSYLSSKRFRLKKRIKQLFSKTYLGSCAYLYFAWIKHGKYVVKKYDSEIRKADIILSNDIYTAYYTLQRYPEKPLFFVMHNSGDLYNMLFMRLPYLRNGIARRYLESIRESVYKKAQKIIFVSKFAKDNFGKAFPNIKDKCIYVCEGIEDVSDRFPIHFGKLRIVSVGTINKRKNQIGLLNALKELHLDIEAYIIGDGPDYLKCCNYIRENHLSTVKMVGPVRNSEMHRYLEKGNLFISASYDEGLPAVGIEALRSGLPLIVTDVGGCRELIHDNGRLIPVGKEYLENAILEMNKRIDELPDLGRKSRELYEEEFSIDKMIEEYVSLFQEVKS